MPADTELVAWMRSSVKKSLEQNYHSLGSDGVRASSSPHLSHRNNSGRNNLTSSSPNFQVSSSHSSPKADKPVCRDWERTGKCSREKCRFAHPPLRKRH